MVIVVPGNYIPSFHAAQGILWMATAEITYDESTDLAAKIVAGAAATTGQIVACKDITLTPPKGETEQVNLLGVETTEDGAGVPITGSFQNTVVDEKSWGMGTMTCTLIVTGNAELLPDFLQMACGIGLDVGDFMRYSFGDSTANQTRNAAGAIVLNLYNGVQEFNVLLNKPYVNVGAIKPTGMGGHFEIEFEAKCAAKNFLIEEDEN